MDRLQGVASELVQELGKLQVIDDAGGLPKSNILVIWFTEIWKVFS